MFWIIKPAHNVSIIIEADEALEAIDIYRAKWQGKVELCEHSFTVERVIGHTFKKLAHPYHEVQ